MVLVTILLTLMMGALTWRAIAHQLAPLAAAKALAAQSSAAGASQSLPVIRQDEIGDMISGFNHLLETLKRAEYEKAELETRNRQLQKAESLGLMAASIAHLFNNRLQSIRSSLDMIGEVSKSESTSKYLSIAKEATGKAAQVSKLLLVYLGQVSMEREPCSLAEICNGNLSTIRKTLPVGVTLEANLHSEEGTVIQANEAQIQLVLAGLVSNACEAMSAGGGRIKLELGVCDAQAISTLNRYPIGWKPHGQSHTFLAVEDTGGGIPEEDIDKIFDPFFSSKSVGRGLGLPVVLGLVQAHGGGITVASKLGMGSVFRVHFPVTTHSQPVARKHAEPVSRSTSRNAILMVDDDDLLLESTGPMIETLGFTLLKACDGIEALAVFHKHQAEICCVLTDLTMPRMNGMELLVALRQIDPDLPVVLASGYDQTQALSGTDAAPPQAFLYKPFGLKQLRDALDRALGVL